MVNKTSKKVRKVKSFNPKKFIRMANELRDAVKKEEKKYGSAVLTS